VIDDKPARSCKQLPSRFRAIDHCHWLMDAVTARLRWFPGNSEPEDNRDIKVCLGGEWQAIRA